MAFGGHLLDFDKERVPATREFEPNAGTISTAYDAIRKHHEFPFWNPNADTGVPYLGDPVNYLFNPIGSVPGLSFGAVNGPKVGILLAVIFSGLSGYYLASVLGLSLPARLWAGIMLAVNGHLAARMFGGQYQLGIAFPFIAFSFAFFIETLRRDHRAYPVLTGLSISVLLFSGFLYYFVFVIPGLVITFLFFAFSSQLGGQRLDELHRLTRRALAAAAWTAGFSAVLLIPFAQTVDFVQKERDPFLKGSQPLLGSFLNFFRSDRAYYHEGHHGQTAGFLQEYYSYVGLVPLLALPFVLLAFRRGNRLLIALMATLFLFYLAWSSAKHTPFHLVYERYTFLYNLRWTSRALAAATPFFVMLGAVGIDELLQLLTGRKLNPAARRWFGRLALPPLPVGMLLAAIVLALIGNNLWDVLQTNRSLLALGPRREDHKVIAQWFDENEPGPAYVWMFDGSPGVSLRLAEHGIPRLEPVYWKPRLKYGIPGNPPPDDQLIHPRAQYVVLSGDQSIEQPVPSTDLYDATFVASFPERRIFRLENSPPFASLVSSARLPVGGQVPWQQTQSAEARIVSPNVIEVEVTAADPSLDRLLVLESYFQGWRVEVDGERAGAADNLRGFVSTEARPGRHIYRFIFDPAAQRFGLAITIGTALGAALYLSPLPSLAARLRRRAARN